MVYVLDSREQTNSSTTYRTSHKRDQAERRDFGLVRSQRIGFSSMKLKIYLLSGILNRYVRHWYLCVQWMLITSLSEVHL